MIIITPADIITAILGLVALIFLAIHQFTNRSK